jgi:hypothetical protein
MLKFFLFLNIKKKRIHRHRANRVNFSLLLLLQEAFQSLFMTFFQDTIF